MKVILLRDVAKIGKRFSIVEVPDGFAQNKLIPQKDAEPATPANVKRILEKKKKDSSAAAADIEQVVSIHAKFAEEPLRVVMEANEQGHLFQSVHTAEIVAAARERKVTIPASIIKIDSPIKSVGLHEVRLEVGGTSYSLGLEVTAKSAS